MLLRELFIQAWIDIKSHRRRALMTMFGIVWGISSVIVLVGYGTGFQQYFTREFGKTGERVISVVPGRTSYNIGSYRAGRLIHLDNRDVEAIAEGCNLAEKIAPEIWPSYQMIKYKDERRRVHTLGVLPWDNEIRNVKVYKGRFINAEDISQARCVCFLAANIRDKLFGAGKEAVGEIVQIKGIRFQVIGVAERKGEQLSIKNSLDDEKLYIPLTTARNLFTGTKYYRLILVQPRSILESEQCAHQIRKSLAVLHKFNPEDEEAVYISNWTNSVIVMARVGLGIKIFLGAAGAITLFIGGIGVMNIMLVSVRERTREIGILKAVGAKNRHIFIQFFTQALIITFSAGVIGVLIGVGICWIIAQIPLPRFFNPPIVDISVIFLAFAIMTLVGIFAGTLPAIKAASLHPIESLRYE